MPSARAVEVASDATAIVQEYDALLTTRNTDNAHSWIMKRVFDLVQNLPVLIKRADKVEIKLHLQKATGYIKCLKGGLGNYFSTSVSFRKALIRK
jgi:hypothetical protein